MASTLHSLSPMKRPARAVLFVPVAALAASGVLAIACRGGGTLDGIDGSWTDGEATRITATAQICEKAMVAIDDTAAESAAPDAPGCAADTDCTVRMAGDYCACPSTPRPMLLARAAAFDESLSGITRRCTCEIMPCDPPRGAKAVCREGRCALADPPK